MARDVSRCFISKFSGEYLVGPAGAAVLDPFFIKQITLLSAETRIVVKPGVEVIAAGESGERGDRLARVAMLLRLLSGTEAAAVVNNNAGAVMLALAALAGGHSATAEDGEAGPKLGTPRYMAPEQIEEYYTHIRRGRPPEPEQLEELTQRYEARVRAHIHHRLGPGLRRRADTEDLLQSTLALVVRDLPGVGRLFKSTNNTSNKSELLIFVTPRILEEGSSIY